MKKITIAILILILLAASLSAPASSKQGDEPLRLFLPIISSAGFLPTCPDTEPACHPEPTCEPYSTEC